jgi:hypothetical protein
MRNSLLILTAVFLFSCTEDVPEVEEVNPNEELADTRWVAPDVIADYIWSGENLQHIEFLDAENMHQFDTNDGRVKNLEEGTFVYEPPILTIYLDDEEREFEITGSLMVSTHQATGPSGDMLTYQEQ